MQLRNSNCRRGSFRRKRHTSSRSAASITTKGSIAPVFFDLMRLPNFSSRTAMMSAAVMRGPLLGCPLRLGRRGAFLVALGELVLLLQRLDRIGVVQLRRQLRVA